MKYQQIKKIPMCGGVKTSLPQKLAFWAFLSSFLLLTVSNQAQAQNSSFLKTYYTPMGNMDAKEVVPLSANRLLVGGFAAASNGNDTTRQAHLCILNNQGDFISGISIFPLSRSADSSGSFLYDKFNFSTVRNIIQSKIESNVYFIGGTAGSQPFTGEESIPILDSIEAKNLDEFNEYINETFLGMQVLSNSNNQNLRPFLAKVTVLPNDVLRVDWLKQLEDSSGANGDREYLANILSFLDAQGQERVLVTTGFIPSTLNASLNYHLMDVANMSISSFRTNNAKWFLPSRTKMLTLNNGKGLIIQAGADYSTFTYKPCMLVTHLDSLPVNNGTISMPLVRLHFAEDNNGSFEDFSIMPHPSDIDSLFLITCVGYKWRGTRLFLDPFPTVDPLGIIATTVLDINTLTLANYNPNFITDNQLGFNLFRHIVSHAGQQLVLGNRPRTDLLSQDFGHVFLNNQSQITGRRHNYSMISFKHWYNYAVHPAGNNLYEVGRITKFGVNNTSGERLMGVLFHHNYTGANPSTIINQNCIGRLPYNTTTRTETSQRDTLRINRRIYNLIDTSFYQPLQVFVESDCQDFNLVCNPDTINNLHNIIFVNPTMSSMMPHLLHNTNRNHVFINGDLTIDQDPQQFSPGFDFSGYTFYFGDYSRAINTIPGNVPVYFKNTTFTSCIDFMWRGFIAFQNNQVEPLFYFDSCSFSNAFTAIHADNGATIHLNNCSFNGNNIALRISRNTTQGHQSIVFNGNNSIIGNPTTSGQTANNALVRPFNFFQGSTQNFKRADYGVLVETAQAFTLNGNLSISNTQTGIFARNVDTIAISNVHFEDIYRFQAIDAASFSISATGSINNTHGIMIDSIVTFFHAAQDNRRISFPTINGFTMPNYARRTQINHNYMLRVVNAINVNGGRNTKINDNIIRNFFTGIQVFNVFGTTKVNNNHLNLASDNNLLPSNMGIRVTGLNNTTQLVLNNKLFGINQIGIEAFGVPNVHVIDNEIRIKRHRSLSGMNAQALERQVGISLNGASVGKVLQNRIAMQLNQDYTQAELGATTDTMRAFLTRGVEFINNSVNFDVSENGITLPSIGFYMSHALHNNVFWCNTMGNFQFAMRVDLPATGLHDFGTLDQAADNIWLATNKTNPLRFLNNSLNPLTYYHRNASINSNIYAPVPFISPSANVFSNTGGVLACSFHDINHPGPPVGPSPPESNPFAALAAMVPGLHALTNIGGLHNESEAIFARALFKAIADSIAHNYTNIDPMYMAFYNHNAQGAYGQYRAMLAAAYQENEIAFDAVRPAFVPISLQELLVTQVLDLVRPYHFNLSVADVDTLTWQTLNDIQALNPYVVGPAPFFAAHFMGIIVPGHGNPAFKIATILEQANPANKQVQLRAYPNPLQGQLLNVEIDQDDLAYLRLFDLQGRQVANQAIQQGGNFYRYPCGQHAAGLYVLEVTTQSGQTLRTKLVIN